MGEQIKEFRRKHGVLRFVNHSRRVIALATRHGWLPGARYTNLRDVRDFDQLGFLDIDWKRYDFQRHLDVAKATRPLVTVARDVETLSQLSRTIEQAYELSTFAKFVVIVPKDRRLADVLDSAIPPAFLLGYSVPTKYGGTKIPPEKFRRPVHLLGGRPDVQRRLARTLPVFSVDCNRFTLDAAYGDYFDGDRFRPHPEGGYERCLRSSIVNITKLWKGYGVLEVNDGIKGSGRQQRIAAERRLGRRNSKGESRLLAKNVRSNV